MKPRPYSLRIFLPDGTPDGLRVVEKSNWTGQCVVCPHSLFNEKKTRGEFEGTGVYVLTGTPDPGALPRVNVGQTDQIRTRLSQHYKKKDFWDRAIFFTSKDGTLNRAHVLYLEARLLQLARDAKRAVIDNDQFPPPPNLSEAEEADVESFLLDMLSVLPLVGVTAFERIRSTSPQRDVLMMNPKGSPARGFEGLDGFVVQEGSKVVKAEVPSMPAFASKMRQELMGQGVLVVDGDHLVFTQDYLFNSPSTAAAIVAGRNANGRIEWRDQQGRTLKEIQEAQVDTEGGGEG